MNKKEAVAYGQITLETMIHSTYTKKINLQNFGMEMRQAFKIYPKNIVLSIADAKVEEEKLNNKTQNGNDYNKESD